MRKVKVEREMPFAKVGDVFEIDRYDHYEKGSLHLPGWSFNSLAVSSMIANGWLSYVDEEKTLEEKFDNYTQEFFGKKVGIIKGQSYRLAQLARTHYLEAFDKADKKQSPYTYITPNERIKYIRKSLEDA